MDKEFFNGMNLAEDISEEDFQYIKDGWEKVQDALSKEEFIGKFNKCKEEYKEQQHKCRQIWKNSDTQMTNN